MKPCWSYTVTGKMLPGRGDGERLMGQGVEAGCQASRAQAHLISPSHPRLTPGAAALLRKNERPRPSVLPDPGQQCSQGYSLGPRWVRDFLA